MHIRTKIINQLIEINKYGTYLEIGVDDCSNFDNITIQYKVSVDPNDSRGIPTYKMTSADFFKINQLKFDIIFIDGLHIFETVYNDLLNSLNVLNENGIVLLHDTFPKKYEHQTVPPSDPCWTGDVWKAILKAQVYIPNIEIKTYDVESGITFVKKSKNKITDLNLKEIYDYNYFQENFERILNLTKFEQ